MFQLNNSAALSPSDLALCRRVFDHVCAVRQVSLDMHREEIAKQILEACRQGVNDEGSLIKLMGC